MLTKTLDYLRHHAIAIVALICSLLALAGASYAAIKLPKNSVGNPQIKRGAVAPPKFSKQIGGYVRMYAKIGPDGKLLYSRPAARLVNWTSGPSVRNGGIIEWKAATSNKCIALSTSAFNLLTPVTTNATLGKGASRGYKTGVSVQMSGPSGVSIAVVC